MWAIASKLFSMKYAIPKMAAQRSFYPAAILNLSNSYFIQEVPELEDGTIIIERIVRDAGYRTKLAVPSTDPKVDPVGACVGVRGTRVKNIIRELNNEKIDIIPFTDDTVQLLQNALASHRNQEDQRERR